MHDDQVSQNARVEAAEEYRRWATLNQQEQAATLQALAAQLAARQDLSNSISARQHALGLAAQLGPVRAGAESPIDWAAMSNREFAMQLRDMAQDYRQFDQRWADYCLDMAEQLERERQRGTREIRTR